MLNDWLERFQRHDRRALAKLLTLLSHGENVEEITSHLPQAAKPSRVAAVTGSAGVGKSSLIGKLIERICQEGKTVAVLACDPQSPLSGGALLGDRFRMPALLDDGVFIRSLATAGGLGAIAAHLDSMLRLLKAFGFDVILIETVGAGQGDTTVRDLADVLVLLLQPETGDDLQWEKAGVLEVADVIVVQKADLPGAESVEAQIRAILGLSTGPAVPVLRVSAKNNQGIDELWKTIGSFPLQSRTQQRCDPDWNRLAQTMLRIVCERAERVDEHRAKRIIELYERGIVCPSEICNNLLDLLYGIPPAHSEPSASKEITPNAS